VDDLRFTMRFEPMTIEHLGLKLYSQFPPVITEFISNAYDAEASKVDISVPSGEFRDDSEVVVRDYGIGMDADEIQNEYLPIGRNRRGATSQTRKSKNDKRIVTGRKGLGKLSAFGVARQSEVRCIRGGRQITFRLDYDEIRTWSETHGNTEYEPTIVDSRTGSTDETDGVEITLRKLRRRSPLDIEALRRSVARRLTMVGVKHFRVYVNGLEVRATDRVRRTDCRKGWSWGVDDLPHGMIVGGADAVNGWVGFVAEARQIGRGIDIFASGKSVELGSFFNLPSTHAQYARAYLVGQVHADFLDAPEEDLVSTARNSVVWEQPRAQQLEAWGQQTVKWALEKWVEKQSESKQKRIFTEGNFQEWLNGRSPREQRTAQKLVAMLAADPKIEDDSIPRLVEIVKSSIEHRAFEELVQELSVDPGSATTLLRLFQEWRVIEAREWLQLMDGRLHALKKLHRFIEEGALEVQEMQPLLKENLWILDSAWSEADHQPTYSDLLHKHCKEPRGLKVEDRRLDIFAVRAGGAAVVVELKRPEKKLSREDLEQIERYVDWARSNVVGTGKNAPKYANGLLVVGYMSAKGDIREKLKRLQGSDIRVETYRDLYEAHQRLYREFERRLAGIAPEYAKTRKASSHGRGRRTTSQPRARSGRRR
jgi:hypothetical protein